MQKLLKRYWPAIVVVVIVLLVAGAYAIGYRVEGGMVVRVGKITLTNLPKGTSVYADQVLQQTTTTSGSVTLELIPGNHTVIVGAPNDVPWSTVISISSGSNTDVDPILVATNMTVTALSGQDVTSALAAIASSTLPTEAAPIHMENGCTNVYVSNNQIIESAATSTPGCTPPAYLCIDGSCAPTIVFAPTTPLSNVFPYPGRQDALVVGFANTLYALSLNPTNPQFFAPLVRGAGAVFGQLANGTIVVEQGQTVSKISL